MLPPAPTPVMILLVALAVAMIARPTLEEPLAARAGDVPIVDRGGPSFWWSSECRSDQRWSRFYGKCVRDTSF